MNQIFFTGVVEDLNDPLELGRVRVRVVGVHTEDKTMVPTESLPWAVPLNGITSASMNGIGTSPTGLLCGSWVMVTFIDPESKQQPIVMGSLAGIPTSELNTHTGDEDDIVISTSKNNGILPDDITPNDVKSEDVIGDFLQSIGITTGNNLGSNLTQPQSTAATGGTFQPTEQAIPKQNPVRWKLGQTSEQYESSGKGPGTINDYLGSASSDPGGASYGVYQLASYLPQSRSRESRKNSPVLEFTRQSRFKSMFEGLTPGTVTFDNVWKDVSSKYSFDFREEQHDYIKRVYYDPVISKLKARGYNFTNNGPAVQDAIWSTSVQFWHTRTINLIIDALKGKSSVSDEEFVNLVYDLKEKRFSSTAKRVREEKQALLNLIRSGATVDNLTTDSSTAEGTTTPTKIDDTPEVSTEKAEDFRTFKENSSSIARANRVGFTDPNGVYPLPKFLNEPDVNRLARNSKINDTVVAKKQKDRTTGVIMAGGQGTWSQPEVPYATQYPNNQVMETKCGHIMEFDSTPGAERIQVYHMAGSFVEIDNNGSMVRKIMGDDYQILERNGHIYVGGKCSLTVSGSINIYAYGDTNIETEGDTNVVGYNDINVTASGNMNLSSKETMTLKANKIVVDSDTSIEVFADSNINIETLSDLNAKAVNINFKSQANFAVAANGTYNAYSAGDMSMRGANFYVDTDGITSLEGGQSTAQDFVAVVPVQSSFSVTSEARRDADEVLLEHLIPTTRIDNSAYFFETEEETKDSAEYQKYRQTIIASGNGSVEDFNKKPVEEARDDEKSVVSKELVPADADTINSLSSFPDNLKLSPNFNLGQVSSRAAVSKYAVRDQFGITAADAVANLQNICLNVLEPIFKAYPNMFVTSGFRHDNSGSKVSDHVLGQAVDLQFRGASKSDYFEIAKNIRRLVPHKQLLLEYKTTGSGMPWIHVSLSRNNNDNRNSVATFFNHRKHSDGLTKLA